MHTFFFLAMAFFLLICLMFAFQAFQNNRFVYAGIALAVIFGLFYDNLVIGIGRFIGEGDFLERLNAGRFFIHAVFTPMLIMYAVATADQLGMRWASRKITYSIFGFLTVGLIGLGVYEDVIKLALSPEVEHGLLRYVNAHASGAPIPAIITILVMIGVGASIWRSHKWPVLCVGSILMFIAAGAGASILLLANFGELLLAGAIVWTNHEVAKRTPTLNLMS